MTNRYLGCLLLLAVFAVSVIALPRWLYTLGERLKDVDPY